MPQYVAGPHILVYKTKADYSKLVPVIFSEDKKTVVSYLSASDLKKDEGCQTCLFTYISGFTTAARQVAFMKLTYQQYIAPRASSYALDELYALIIDKDLLVEL